MSDLFHAKVPLPFIQRVFEVMADTPQRDGPIAPGLRSVPTSRSSHESERYRPFVILSESTGGPTRMNGSV
jgi:protein gp37